MINSINFIILWVICQFLYHEVWYFRSSFKMEINIAQFLFTKSYLHINFKKTHIKICAFLVRVFSDNYVLKSNGCNIIMLQQLSDGRVSDMLLLPDGRPSGCRRTLKVSTPTKFNKGPGRVLRSTKQGFRWFCLFFFFQFSIN